IPARRPLSGTIVRSRGARRGGSPSPRSAMTDTLQLSHWINGEKVGAERPSESLNPSDTRELVARVPDGGVAEVDAAVAAARAAFPAWSEASPEVRSDILDKAGTLVMERREQLGRRLSRAVGTTLDVSVGA